MLLPPAEVLSELVVPAAATPTEAEAVGVEDGRLSGPDTTPAKGLRVEGDVGAAAGAMATAPAEVLDVVADCGVCELVVSLKFEEGLDVIEVVG